MIWQLLPFLLAAGYIIDGTMTAVVFSNTFVVQDTVTDTNLKRFSASCTFTYCDTTWLVMDVILLQFAVTVLCVCMALKKNKCLIETY